MKIHVPFFECETAISIHREENNAAYRFKNYTYNTTVLHITIANIRIFF